MKKTKFLREALIYEHRNFSTNIFTENGKFFMEDWINNSTKKYELVRDVTPITLTKKQSKKSEKGKPNFENISHKNIKSISNIDNQLWDQANWKGFGFFRTQEIFFGLLLAFENVEAGKKIFEKWIRTFGKTDQQDNIKITIIQGVNKENPHWYRVVISKKNKDEDFEEGGFVITSSRMLDITPKDGNNLKNILFSHQYFKKYIIVPAMYNLKMEIIPFIELGILKNDLTIKNAWEIGVHDFDRVAIRKGDNPVIPDNIENPPILELIKDLSNREI